jgi:two-component system alkaline phosphatase synthesis response regulator PhoP
MPEKHAILVADDEAFINRSLTFVLKQEGFQVISAHDGLEAWERLNQGEKPVIAFVDVMMPRMDGFELCRRIKSDPRLKDIYVIFLTARWQDSDREKARKAGGDEYITKPFSPSALVKKIRTILAERSEVRDG